MLDRIVSYWRDTAINGDEFHRDDRELITGMKHALPRGRIPEPWFGVPSKAKIFYLTLNPGHKNDDGSDAEPWRSFCRAMMREAVDYDGFRKAITPAGFRWFKENHGKFADVAFPWICNLRLLAYPSADKASLGKIAGSLDRIPSTKLMKQLVHDELAPRAQKGEILLLVMRSRVAWGFQHVDREYWDNGLFVSQSPRNPSISPTSRVGSKISDFLRSHRVEL